MLGPGAALSQMSSGCDGSFNGRFGTVLNMKMRKNTFTPGHSRIMNPKKSREDLIKPRNPVQQVLMSGFGIRNDVRRGYGSLGSLRWTFSSRAWRWRALHRQSEFVCRPSELKVCVMQECKAADASKASVNHLNK